MVSKQNMLNEQEKAREGKNKEDNPNLENDSSKLADIEPKSRYLTLKEREKRALDYEHRVMLFEYLERGLSVEQIEEIAEKNNISISPRLKASLLNKYSEIENDQTVKEDKIVAVDHEDYE